jgi:prepilin-type N-terminal cleavage/methylation domain-containing protein
MSRRAARGFTLIELPVAIAIAAGLFSALILTSPLATAVVLLLFIVVSLATSLLFERRTFCRYLCPIGGFVGVYSQVAPLAVRVKDPAVCASHHEKTCFTGALIRMLFSIVVTIVTPSRTTGRPPIGLRLGTAKRNGVVHGQGASGERVTHRWNHGFPTAARGAEVRV